MASDQGASAEELWQYRLMLKNINRENPVYIAFAPGLLLQTTLYQPVSEMLDGIFGEAGAPWISHLPEEIELKVAAQVL